MTTEQDAAPVRTAELVRRAAAGDTAAWEQLVDDYIGLIWAVTRGFRLNDADAGDVVQTTWLRLLEYVDRLHDPSRVGAWLATTARRECLRVLAQSKRTTLAGEDDHLLERADLTLCDIDSRLLAAEQSAEVQAALDRLPARWRQLLVMLVTEPRPSYEEISRRLDIPIGSIGPTRGRALRRLQDLLFAEVSPVPVSASW